MSDPKNLGERLRFLRKELKLAQADVAAAVDISRSHLAEIEAGKNPGFVTFIELAKFFSVSLDYLYFGLAAHKNNVEDEAVELRERVLLDFWRGLTDSQKQAVFDLLLSDRSSKVA
ncbi:helix-turn-helix domain-containing protein [Gluconobacter cerinus]|uniref:helix-turn-helix domain-containing protein n=1 Tax=Gluconobacter cerinus TaxID=38307 RepID=UPI001B8AEAC0|nr:helix-turn-helix transcriptional regulator [Gluconobacter cerinus]MBS1067278.1 helix-turn-helix transcriptional regulator [Gluconobacter cerinus]